MPAEVYLTNWRVQILVTCGFVLLEIFSCHAAFDLDKCPRKPYEYQHVLFECVPSGCPNTESEKTPLIYPKFFRGTTLWRSKR
jgi:hypothetical protein